MRTPRKTTLKFRSGRNFINQARSTRPRTTRDRCQAQITYAAIIVGLGRSIHRVRGPTSRRAIEHVSKAVNIDLINRQACQRPL